MSSPRAPQPRILLVDDLALFRRMIPARLGALGREVHAVGSAVDALEYLADHHPHILLLDVVMPGQDGFSLCQDLKADVRTRYLTVIMLTALSGAAHDRSLEAGADDYLPKKVDDAVMRIRIRLHLNLQELRLRQVGQIYQPSPASILVASAHGGLGIQLQAQFQQDGHRVRVLQDVARVADAIRPEDRLLVLDLAGQADEVPECLAMLRADAQTATLPVLLLCEKEQMPFLAALETMVDDVLWKPLNAKVTRFRLPLLLELAERSTLPGA